MDVEYKNNHFENASQLDLLGHPQWRICQWLSNIYQWICIDSEVKLGDMVATPRSSRLCNYNYVLILERKLQTM
jgi:hypothetical protein